METGLRWRVGVSASLELGSPAPAAAPPSDRVPAGAIRRRTRLSEVVDVQGFDDADCAQALRALADAKAQLAAFEADVVTRFADLRPDLWDLGPDDPAAAAEGWGSGRTFTGVTEFFTDELAAVLGISRTRADTLANCSLVLREQLVATWEALADGLIDLPRAQALVTVLGRQTPAVEPEVIAAVEREALQWAVQGEGPYRLRERAAALLLLYDAEASDRRRKEARRNTDVTIRNPVDGFPDLVVRMPAEVATASRDTCDTYARMRKATGDTRPIGELRALVAADLLLRPWDTTREPVTAHLTLLASLPSLLDGDPDSLLPVPEVDPRHGSSGDGASECPDPVFTGGACGQCPTVGPWRRPPGPSGVRADRRPAHHHRAPPRAAHPARVPHRHGPRHTTRLQRRPRPHRSGHRCTAGGPDAPPAPAAGSPRLPRPRTPALHDRGDDCACTAIVQLRGARRPAADRRLPPHRGPTTVHRGPRPHLPAPRLRATSSLDRRRPRRGLPPGRADRLRQPVLALPTAPPAQDPRPRVAVLHDAGRTPVGHHPQWRHPDDRRPEHAPAAPARRPPPPARDRTPGPARSHPADDPPPF